MDLAIFSLFLSFFHLGAETVTGFVDLTVPLFLSCFLPGAQIETGFVDLAIFSLFSFQLGAQTATGFVDLAIFSLSFSWGNRQRHEL